MIGLFFAFAPGKIPGLHFDSIHADSPASFVHKSVQTPDAYLAGSFLNKFSGDKCLCETETHLVALDGVILNLTELLREYHADSLQALLLQFADTPERIIPELRGKFAGVILEKQSRTVRFFTDHLACRTLYYYCRDGLLVVASEVLTIARFLKENKLPYSLDYVGAYSLITYAYMYQDATLIAEVRRVKEGMLFQYDAHGLRNIHYHQIRDTADRATARKIDEREAIEELDERFTEAVRLQHRKNQECGYVDAAALSAGLDSRMTTFALRRVSDGDIINFTYSQSGELDNLTPQKIAAELKNRWLFKSLNNGLDFMDIDRSIALSDGMIYYPWPAILSNALDMWNTDQWGIVHTGIWGDTVVKSYCLLYEKMPEYRIGDSGYSVKLIDRLKEQIGERAVRQHYEIGQMTNFHINGVYNGYSTSFRRCVEEMTPYGNVDFFDFCWSLPFELRARYQLYYAWVNEKYPAAAKYSHNGLNIRGKARIRVGQKSYLVASLPSLAKKILQSKFKPGMGMNPMQYWYDTNPDLKSCMDGYFAEHIHVLQPYEQLFQDTRYLYETGTAWEKTMAISLVGSVRMLFE